MIGEEGSLLPYSSSLFHFAKWKRKGLPRRLLNCFSMCVLVLAADCQLLIKTILTRIVIRF